MERGDVVGIWAWLGRHGRAVKFGSVAAAVVLLGSGLFFGMSEAAGSPAPITSPPGAAHQLATPTKHFLLGTVIERLAQGTVIVRSRAGRFFVVTYDAKTEVRRSGQSVKQTAVRRGTRVTIIGNPTETGFHADIVTITGSVAAAKPAPAPTTPSPSPTQKSTRPSTTPVRRRTPTPAATY